MARMARISRSLVVLAALALAAPGAAAQTPAPRNVRQPSPQAVARAVATITEADIRAGIGVLADDSMRGRETPSPELEQAAQWVAAQFRRIGLRPGGDSGGYIQRFPLREKQMDSSFALTITGGGSTRRALFGREVAILGNQVPTVRGAHPVVLVTGIPADSGDPFAGVSLRGAAVVHVLAQGQLRGSVVNPLIMRGFAEGMASWTFVVQPPDQQWAGLTRAALRTEWELVGGNAASRDGLPVVLAVRDSTVADLLRAAGVDPAAFRANPTFTARPLAGWQVGAEPAWRTLREPTVPNTVGVLPGGDRTLRDEFVVFTAHMDHVGYIAPDGSGRCAIAGADSICNGADDNASGTVGIVELAQAYAALNPRPARTMVFVAVSAEERGLFGAWHYTRHPVGSLDRTVAVIDLDMVGRNARDSIETPGKDYSTLGALAGSLAAEHPELGLALNDPPAQRVYWQLSDHYPFAAQGVPALFFFSGQHPDLHRAGDSLDRMDSDKATRVIRLAFYTGLAVANAAARPSLTDAGRAAVAGAGGH